VAKSLEELFLEKVREEFDRYLYELSSGSPNDYAEYREKVGYIAGLTMASNIFEEIANKARKENLND
jgi:hypothetical protein